MARKVSAREERIIETRFALRELKKLLDPSNFARGDVLDYKEHDAIKVLAPTLRWREGSRAERLTKGLLDIANTDNQDFTPAPIHELICVLEERIPEDIDFSLPKPAKSKDKE